MADKVVCFAGHRFDWQNIGIEELLRQKIIELIEKGYNVFYDGGKGYFDQLSANIVIGLKKKYPHIKIYKILTYYHHDNEKYRLSKNYDGSILPEIEEFHYKTKITKRNEWIVDNSDILVCHVYETFKSGAFNTVKYAKKINKPIIYV